MPLSRRKLRSPQPPGASWLAWPTLQESLSAFPAFGGSFCHETRHLVHQYGPLVTAELRIQTTGELAGEVRVFVAGLQVATIPYDTAGPFRDVIDKLHRRGLPATCRAELDVDAEGHVLVPHEAGGPGRSRAVPPADRTREPWISCADVPTCSTGRSTAAPRRHGPNGLPFCLRKPITGRSPSTVNGSASSSPIRTLG